VATWQPFTHVSGYSNRYKEMLKYLDKAGDVVEIVTTDDVPDAPGKFMDYNIHYTPGFRFPLYKHICLTTDLKMVAYNVLKVRTRARPGTGRHAT
jgi:sulfoquinovosyltransferase